MRQLPRNDAETVSVDAETTPPSSGYDAEFGSSNAETIPHTEPNRDISDPMEYLKSFENLNWMRENSTDGWQMKVYKLMLIARDLFAKHGALERENKRLIGDNQELRALQSSTAETLQLMAMNRKAEQGDASSNDQADGDHE